MLKISIITAVYNAKETIERAVSSVSRQDYPHIEHIVIDGASTDGTLQFLQSRRSQFAVLVSERDSGLYHALNRGISLATGDVVGFLHADDVFAEAGVVRKIAARLADPDVGAAYGDLVYTSARDERRIVRLWRAGSFSREKLERGWMPPHPTFYARRDIYERLGGFDTRHRIAADYDCMLRFLAKGGVVPAYIPQVLVRMRWGGMSNRSVANMLRKSWEDYVALKENNVGGFTTLIRKNLSKVAQFSPEPSGRID